MLPGISGTLVSATYLAERLNNDFGPELGADTRERALKELTRWLQRTTQLLGPASSRRATCDQAVLPFCELLGFTAAGITSQAGVGFTGELQVSGRSVAALLALGWEDPVESRWREAVRAATNIGTRWALVMAGSEVALVDAARSWSRRVLRFVLPGALTDESSSRLVWALLRAEAFAAGISGGAPLVDRLVAASDLHAEEVCATLSRGVFEAHRLLINELGRRRGRRSTGGCDPPPARDFALARLADQSLTVVYRVLFLLFAEARGLVPSWHPVYRHAYSVAALCRRIERVPLPRGLWETLQASARLAHAGCEAGDLRVIAFNGRLFAPALTPLAERARVDDGTIARVLRVLGSRDTRDGRRPVAYGELGVEQLGAVYEQVLEHEPVRQGRQITLERTSQERKNSGSFYTPASLTAFLVRRTLQPLVEGRSAEAILALRVLDPAMGSGAFLVQACRYLALACEAARVRDGEWRAREITPADRARLRQQVVERCLYGVDLNPTAVQVSRLSLWLTTLSGKRPLTFLDHRLAVGNSLLGARLCDVLRPLPAAAARGRRSEMPDLFGDRIERDLAAALPDRFRLEQSLAESLADVRQKERTLATLESGQSVLARWRTAADLWCGAWLTPGPRPTAGLLSELRARVLGRRVSLPEDEVDRRLSELVEAARERRCFHWELAFPEVFFDPHGHARTDAGFDAVLGNPPWDMLRADSDSKPGLDSRPETARTVRFLRDAGVYRLGSGGHPNSYQLFLERTLQLARPGGRFGLVLPGGLAVDHGAGHLRRELLSRTTLDGLVGLGNRRGIFAIHRSTRFLLLVGSRGGATARLRCRFGLQDVSELEHLPDSPAHDPSAAWPVRLDREWLERTDPERLAIPELTDSRDLGLLVRVGDAVPSLADPSGWNVRLGRELNATDDKPHFVELESHDAGGGLLVVGGKHIDPFQLRLETVHTGIDRTVAMRLLGGAQPFARPRLAYRDVAGRDNRLTLIAAILPAGTVSTHTLFCVKSPAEACASPVLLALLNSLVANYLVRLRVTTHVSAGLLMRVPVPKPAPESAEAQHLAAAAGELQAQGISGAPDAYASLNATVARLYHLTRDDYCYIVGTFPLLPQELRERCIEAFTS